jgi:hypothetical protein
VQVMFDEGMAVAAVGGDRAGGTAGPAGDPLDGGRQLRGGAVFDAVVQNDAGLLDRSAARPDGWQLRTVDRGVFYELGDSSGQ